MTGRFELEALETRKLLSATLSSHHVLYVTGTPHSDAITFELEKHHPGVLNVTVNGNTARFYTANVHSLVLQNGRGNDSIIFNDRFGKIPGQPEEHKHHHENNFVSDDDGTDVTVDDYSDATDDGSDDDSGDQTMPPPDDGSTTQPTDDGSSDNGGDDSGGDSNTTDPTIGDNNM
jgi:hypothetical protein